MVQCLGCGASTARGAGSIPGRGTKILHAVRGAATCLVSYSEWEAGPEWGLRLWFPGPQEGTSTHGVRSSLDLIDPGSGWRWGRLARMMRKDFRQQEGKRQHW